MGDTAPSCRLAVILASESRAAIVFRHGPSKQTRLIAWDRATDGFEPGQWMKGTRVYDERSAISPDGAHLLLFLGTFRPPFQTYTVLSRPPYYTALALWPKGDTWGGGGTFSGPRDIVLDHRSSELAPGFFLPCGFSTRLAEPGADALLTRLRAHHEPGDTWRRHGEAVRWVKSGADGVQLVAVQRQTEPYHSVLDYSLVTAPGEVALAGAQWADTDTNGDILFSVGGRLYRLRSSDIGDAMVAGDAMSTARLLADFSDMRFEPIVAPYSSGRMLDDPFKFSPRLDRVTKEDRPARPR